ncbi:MAG: glycosyltransferase [Anaerolineae bacterium]|nr:glycosyltransferase [Anaerolineae bacterium]
MKNKIRDPQFAMHILFVVPYVPTPIRVRPYNLIRALAARGHHLTLATLWSSAEERAALGALQAWGVRVLAEPLPRLRSLLNCLHALPSDVPLQAVYCWSPVLRARIEQELAPLSHSVGRGAGGEGAAPPSPSAGRGAGGEGPQVPVDLVHVEHLRGVRYGLGLDGTPVVWDSVDCISYLFTQSARDSRSWSGRLLTRLDLGRTRRYEGQLVSRFARVLVTSPVDRRALLELWQAAQKSDGKRFTPSPASVTDEAPITVLPNGVDLDYFRPGDGPRAPETLVISGKMSYHANVTAVLYLVEEIMPRVWAQRPGVRVQVVGAWPPRRIRQLAERFPGRVEVTGWVPDIRPYLQRARLAVAPLRYGAGIQNKVLEALACATPVVATPQACGALQVQAERDLLVADSAEAFARQVLRLLDDDALAARLGAAGRRYVERHHDWNTVAAQLEGIYAECVTALNMRRTQGIYGDISACSAA